MNEFLSWMIGFLIHVVWWPLFALLLIKSNDLNISLKEMITTKPKLKILLPLLVFALVYNIAGFFINSSGYGTKMKLYNLIVTAATVGIFEESGLHGFCN